MLTLDDPGKQVKNPQYGQASPDIRVSVRALTPRPVSLLL